MADKRRALAEEGAACEGARYTEGQPGCDGSVPPSPAALSAWLWCRKLAADQVTWGRASRSLVTLAPRANSGLWDGKGGDVKKAETEEGG